MDNQQNLQVDVNFQAKCQTPKRKNPKNFARTKSDIDLEEIMERRTQQLEELIGLGQATLGEEQCNIDCQDDDGSVSPIGHPEEDESLSPAKRRRQASHSWQLLFDYADQVSTRLQRIDGEFWSKSAGADQENTFTKHASQRQYEVPEELVFVAEGANHTSEKLHFARTKHKLSKAVKSEYVNREGVTLLPEHKPDTLALAQSNPSRQFWPEVSQLKKDMNALREKLMEAKKERSRTTTMIQKLHGDLVKLEATE